MHLISSLGLASFDLVGYSMGAIVSLLVAAQDTRVRRLVVGGVGEGVLVCGGVDRRVLPNLELAAALEAEDGAAAARNPAVAGMRAFVQAVRGDRLALAAQARAVHCEPIPLDRIAVPTLLLAGDDDPLARRPEALADAIAGARFERLRGDHLSALGDPRCLEVLLAFLR
jgi:pimeloyl-ACP methyl ester carboxylesterase